MLLCFSFCRRGSRSQETRRRSPGWRDARGPGAQSCLCRPLSVAARPRDWGRAGSTGPRLASVPQQRVPGQRSGPAHLSRRGCSSRTPDTASCPAAYLSLPAARRWTAPQGAPKLFPGAGRGGGWCWRISEAAPPPHRISRDSRKEATPLLGSSVKWSQEWTASPHLTPKAKAEVADPPS